MVIIFETYVYFKNDTFFVCLNKKWVISLYDWHIWVSSLHPIFPSNIWRANALFWLLNINIYSTGTDIKVARLKNFFSLSEGCKSRVVGCGPDCWSIPNTLCDQGQCGCEAGHRAQADTRGQLVTCLPLSHVTNTTMARAEGDINIHYYPGTE